jgi:hypothetical protein
MADAPNHERYRKMSRRWKRDYERQKRQGNHERHELHEREEEKEEGEVGPFFASFV